VAIIQIGEMRPTTTKERAAARKAREAAELAFQQYVALEGRRSHGALASANGYPVRTIDNWARKFRWKERLSEISRLKQARLDVLTASREAESEAARMKVMHSGFALEYVRIAALDTITEELYKRILAEGIFDGDRIRDSWIRTFRELLGDIASEKSERARSVKVFDEQEVRRLSEKAGVDPERVLARVRDLKKQMREGVA
jgi:hypothetical protein